MTSNGRKYTTYGKQKMKIGTSNKDWMAVVGSGSSSAVATGYRQSPTFQAHSRRTDVTEIAQGKAGSGSSTILPQAAQPSRASVRSNTHVIQEEQDNNKQNTENIHVHTPANGVIDLSEDSVDLSEVQAVVRQRVISLSSESTSSSVEVVVKPRKRNSTSNNKTRPKRVIVIDSPPASPAPSSTEHAVQPTTPFVKASSLTGKSMPLRPVPLGRKDSNNASLGQAKAAAAEASKHEKPSVNSTRFRRVSSAMSSVDELVKEAASLEELKSACRSAADNLTLPTSSEQNKGDDKENLPAISAYPPKSPAKPTMKTSTSKSTKASTSRTPVPSFPSSSRPSQGRLMSTILSSPNKSTSPKKASSSSSGINNLSLPPPRGHGSNATASWRRPLTPIVMARHRGLDAVVKDRKRVESPLKAKKSKVAPWLEVEVPVVSVEPSKARRRSSRSPDATAEPPESGSGNVTKSAESETLLSEAVLSHETNEEAETQEEAIASISEGATAQIAAVAPETKISSGKRKTRRSSSTQGTLSPISAKAKQAPSESRLTSPQSPRISEHLAERPSTLLSPAHGSPPPALSSSLPEEALPLLTSCAATQSASTDAALPFSSFIQDCPLFPGLRADSSLTWKKLGEATYSEVFTVSTASSPEDTIVVKVIPLHMPALEDGTSLYQPGQDMLQTSSAEDIRREIEITRSLSASVENGYPSLRGAYIVQGSYPSSLLKEWDDWKSGHREKCQNIRPDSFPNSQLYALVCLSHGGSDLETVKLKSWSEAASILWQVAEALAEAEKKLKFEHRDLHWGNILVSSSSLVNGLEATSLEEQQEMPACLASASQSAVKATIIDFTLSRATLPGTSEVLSGGFDDDSIFQGTGDYQYECYRIMKTLVNDSWDSYHATSNIVWLYYLVTKLLHDKKLKKPTLRTRSAITAGPHRNLGVVASIPGSPRAGRGRNTRRTVVQPKTSASAAANKLANEAFQTEKNCHEALQAAENILKAAVEVAIQAAEAAAAAEVNGAGKPRRRSAKASDESTQASPNLLFTSAGDFVAWWRRE